MQTLYVKVQQRLAHVSSLQPTHSASIWHIGTPSGRLKAPDCNIFATLRRFAVRGGSKSLRIISRLMEHCRKRRRQFGLAFFWGTGRNPRVRKGGVSVRMLPGFTKKGANLASVNLRDS